MKYEDRKSGEVVDASLWFKLGDHPMDNLLGDGEPFVVRPYQEADDMGAPTLLRVRLCVESSWNAGSF